MTPTTNQPVKLIEAPTGVDLHPKWAGSVCFMEQTEDDAGVLMDADELARTGAFVPVFFFIREDALHTTIQRFHNGIPTPIWRFKNLSTSETYSVSRISESQPKNARYTLTETIKVMWKTGRYNDTMHFWFRGRYEDSVSSGHCEGVNNELEEAAQ